MASTAISRVGAALFAALLAAPAGALTTRWTIDPSHSHARFRDRIMLVLHVEDELGRVTGTVVYDDADPSRSSVEAQIAIAPETGVAKRDAHLKTADFFDAAHYPTVTFRSTRVSREAAGKLKVEGQLTLHGVTQPVVLEVEGPTLLAEIGRLAAIGTTTLDKTAFGMTGSGANEVEVTLAVEASAARPAEPPAGPKVAPGVAPPPAAR